MGLLGLATAATHCATGSKLGFDTTQSDGSGGTEYTAQGGVPGSGGSQSGGNGALSGGSPAVGGTANLTGGTATGGTAPACTECPGSGCFDLTKDVNNCGECGKACNPGDACYSGQCFPACPNPGEEWCANTNGCVNLTNSDFNCGQCAQECPAGQHCANSICSCPAGLNDCSGACVDFQTDSAHCGNCATDCAAAPCVAGLCCLAPKQVCDTVCVDTSRDRNHCGDCITACPAEQVCSGSECVTGTGGTGSGGTSGTGGGTTECAADGPCAGVACPSCKRISATSGNVGSAEICFETVGAFTLGNCGNFVYPRTLSINGTDMGCSKAGESSSGATFSSLPAKVNGGYCVQVSAGQFDWAYFNFW